MLYNFIKIFHILSATLLLTSMGYCYYVWWQMKSALHVASVAIERIQSLTLRIIVPFAFMQLMTGFTMISLKQEGLTQLWIKASGVGFIVVISSWFAFVYFLISGKRQAQSLMLIFNLLGLLCMIFFMVNKI